VQRRAFTLLEVMIVSGILALAVGIGFMNFRNTSSSSTAVAGNLSMHMDLRRAADILTETLLDGTEVLKPVPGSSLGPLVIRDLANYTSILYLEAEPEKPSSRSGTTYSLVMYTDTYNSSYNPGRKRRLFGGIRRLVFTTITPGLIQAHLTLVDSGGKELSALIEVPLKNVGAAYE